MSPLAILPDTDPRLHLVCPEVTSETWPSKSVLKEMQELCVAAQGAGLAAPQVGILQRFIVVAPEYCPGTVLGALINPKVVNRSPDCDLDWEGCLSSGSRREKLLRYRAVEVEFTTFGGKPVRRWFYKFAARLLQHEIDHLDGILYTTRLKQQEDMTWTSKN